MRAHGKRARMFAFVTVSYVVLVVLKFSDSARDHFITLNKINCATDNIDPHCFGPSHIHISVVNRSFFFITYLSIHFNQLMVRLFNFFLHSFSNCEQFTTRH